MVDRRRLAAYALVVLGGIVAAVVPEAVKGTLGDQALLALSVGGGVVMWAGAMWAERLQHTVGCADERLTQIHYRAGWLAFGTLLGVLIVTTFALGNTDYTIETGYLLAGLLFVGLGVFLGTIAVLKRRM